MVRTSETTDTHEISLYSEGSWEDVLKRVIGFVFVAGMPEQGLRETLVALKEIYEFNLENLLYQLPEPEITRTGVGTVVSKSESPDLTIEE